uniref:sushi, von Willebrand factor type A, EGF and pentraxin domain-containing protein 1 isoform X6 n=1 Tax=Ciona intestinalis TaxID=7719 RepID=UPI000EF5588B|nr:sushi, von Willebrand factor type A, EGF and pentraxin domain-containing protein 1 isoform X6 [Ciona intestinalis]|eukprot:XP_026694014.1 sushi, von Willebrand factor type A, EGF and pentraxin domain-containing protein 1 isoform X6 [Ciona intestinalis]
MWNPLAVVIVVCLLLLEVSAYPHCGVSHLSRRPCGRPAIDRFNCLQRGCCYDRNAVHINIRCYYKASTLSFGNQVIGPSTTPTSTPVTTQTTSAAPSASQLIMQSLALITSNGADYTTALALLAREILGTNVYSTIEFAQKYGDDYLLLQIISAAEGKSPPNQAKLLHHGGENGYPGSQVLSQCSPQNRNNTCGNPFYTTRSSCLRWNCCWDFASRSCYHSTNNIIYMRRRCPPGFTNPPKCIEINECLSNPCMNNGVCVDKINGYKCICPISPAGPNCEIYCATPQSPRNGAVTPVKQFYNANDIVRYSCNVGYDLFGRSENVCTRSGQWSTSTPHCLEACGKPTDIANGRYSPVLTPPYYKINQVVTYACDANYVLQGSPVIICQINGQFTQTRASCIPVVVKCSNPPALLNGQFISAIEYAVNAQVRYTCNTGYRLDNSDVITCQTSGQFTSLTAVCTKVCTTPPTLANGDFTVKNNANQYDINTVLTYTCNSGYRLDNSPTITCQASGQFTALTAVCTRVIKCTNPPALMNGLYSPQQNSYSVNDVITYTCNNGYKINNSPTITCQASGQFTALAATCTKVCSTPPTLANGDFTVKNNANQYDINTVLTYTCNSGYRLDNSPTATCQASGKFTALTAVCTKVCSTPPTLANGDFTVKNNANQYDINTVLTYTCNSGYRLDNSATVTCQASGQFTALTAVCTTVCLIPPPLPNGAYSPTRNPVIFNVNEIITYTCNANFKLKGSNTVRCETNGQYTTLAATCASDDKCGGPPLLTNGEYSPVKTPLEYNINENVVYTCNSGYRLDNSDTITCQAANQWSTLSAVCTKVCLTPPTLTHGSYTPVNNPLKYDINTVLTYTCGSGFLLENSDKITCTSTGQWSALAATCTRVCTAPPALANGDYSPKNNPVVYRIGDTVTYTCGSGYTLSSSATSTCQSTGQWVAPTATCVKVCLTPPSLTNGAYMPVTAEYAVHAVVTYTCNNGYKLENVNSISCPASGTWPALPTTCTRICSTPPTLANGDFTVKNNANQYDINTVLTYTCNGGYRLDNSPTITCQASGKFTALAATCTKVCSTPPTLANGDFTVKNNANQYDINTVLTYTCNSGYRLEKSPSITCQASGKFTSLGAVCTKVCTTPPTLANGDFTVKNNANQYDINTVLTYTCNSGYRLDNSPTATCQASGQFTKLTAVCTKVCTTPPTLANGDFTVKNNANQYDINTVLTYTCNSGYRLEKSPTVTCQASGKFTSLAAVCTTVCSTPPTLANGRFTVKNNANQYDINTVLTYTCNSGYRLDNSATITCQASGQFTSLAATCTKVCSTPPTLANGDFTVKNNANQYDINTVLTYVCNSGYRLDNSATITCQASGKFTALAATCTKVCTTPPTLANGDFTVKNNANQYDINTVLTYTCNSGYRLDNSATVTCQASGQFTALAATCTKVCTTPPTLANGDFTVKNNANQYDINTVLTYTCNSGYRLDNSATVTCQASGQFTSLAATCTKVCSTPPTLANGDFTVKNNANQYDINTVLTYTCNSGYRLDNSATVTCQASGQFSSLAATCTKVCSTPPTLANGDFTVKNNANQYDINTILTYTCNSGYRLDNSATVTCQASGQFTSLAATCTKVCLAPPVLSNGEFTPINNPAYYNINSQVTYTCNSGYRLDNSPTITCQASGQFTALAATCTKVCLAPPTLTNGQFSPVNTPAQYDINAVLTYTCNAGYKLENSPTITCQSTGQFTALSATCTRVCTTPPTLANGDFTVKANQYDINTVLTYTCNSGYRLDNSATATCQASGQFTTLTAVCTKVCSTPPALTNGDFTVKNNANQYDINTVLTYTCNSGYRLDNSATVTCQASGQFTTLTAVCTKVCSTPPTLANGDFTVKNNANQYDINTVLTYTCNSGYRLDNSATVTCQASGQFTSLAAVCTKVCSTPPTLANGDFTVKNNANQYDINTVLTYTCNSGYRLDNSATITCQASGQFTSLAATCTRVCSTPPTLANGDFTVKANQYDINTVLTYTCNSGYRLDNSATVTCQASGQFTSLAATCTKVCSTPPTLANGDFTVKNNANQYDINTVLTYTCNSGYRLDNSATVTCQASGQFTSLAATCTKVCTTPPTLANGDFTVKNNANQYDINTVLTYTCNSGYRLDNSATVTCQASGQFTSLAATCTRVCLTPPTLANGDFTVKNNANQYDINTVLTYTCNSGYRLDNSATVTCQASGQFTALTAVCTRVCSTPPTLANGDFTVKNNANQYDINTVLTYTCNSGYRLDNSATITCQASGQFTAFTAVCTKVCTTPPTLANGDFTVKNNANQYDINTVLTYTCNSGYRLDNSATVTCQASGQFTSLAAVCTLICGEPPIPANGVYAVVKTPPIFNIGDQISYSCNNGFILQGTRVNTCFEHWFV